MTKALNTGLDRKELAILIALLETGVNPEVICQEVRRALEEPENLSLYSCKTAGACSSGERAQKGSCSA